MMDCIKLRLINHASIIVGVLFDLLFKIEKFTAVKKIGK